MYHNVHSKTFFMNTIVLGNEYVQQRIVIQNKETEIIYTLK